MASLVKQVEKKIIANDDLRGFLVLLTEESDAAEESLKKLAKDNDIQRMPLTIYDGVGGPPSYNLAKEAKVTIHLWVGGEVVANFAFGEGELNKKAVKKIVKQIPSLFEK